MVTTEELPGGFETIVQVYGFMARYYNHGRLKNKFGSLKIRSCVQRRRLPVALIVMTVGNRYHLRSQDSPRSSWIGSTAPREESFLKRIYITI